MNFLCKRYDLDDEFHSTEVIDIAGLDEDRAGRLQKTARELYFKTFDPKPDGEDVEPEYASSDSDLDPDEDFDIDST